MKRFEVVAVLLTAATLAAPAQGENWAGRLFGDETKKILIRHADDAGMFLATNTAIQRGMTAANREIDSTSAMAPLHFFDKMIDWFRSHPTEDVGLHLTFTSEWRNYRWGPSTEPPENVKRLLTKHMTFRKDSLAVWWVRAPNTVGEEMQAQIEVALELMNLSTDPGDPLCPRTGRRCRDECVPAGRPSDCLVPTHVDSHMGALYVRKSYFKKFLGRVRDNGLTPVTFEDFAGTVECLAGSVAPNLDAGLVKKLTKPHFRRLRKAQRNFEPWAHPRVDRYCKLPSAGSPKQALLNFLDDVKPGITMLFFHPSDDSSLLRIATNAADDRVAEGVMFADPVVQTKMQNLGIETTSWRELKCRFDTGSACP